MDRDPNSNEIKLEKLYLISIQRVTEQVLNHQLRCSLTRSSRCCWPIWNRTFSLNRFSINQIYFSQRNLLDKLFYHLNWILVLVADASHFYLIDDWWHFKIDDRLHFFRISIDIDIRSDVELRIFWTIFILYDISQCQFPVFTCQLFSLHSISPAQQILSILNYFSVFAIK